MIDFERILYLLLLASPIIISIQILYKRFRPFTNSIKRELLDKGYTLISILPPKLFAKKPFKSFKVLHNHTETSILGFKGEEIFYRRVRYKDQLGNEHETWVKIYTRNFVVYSIEWENLR